MNRTVAKAYSVEHERMLTVYSERQKGLGIEVGTTNMWAWNRQNQCLTSGEDDDKS